MEKFNVMDMFFYPDMYRTLSFVDLYRSLHDITQLTDKICLFQLMLNVPSNSYVHDGTLPQFNGTLTQK